MSLWNTSNMIWVMLWLFVEVECLRRLCPLPFYLALHFFLWSPWGGLENCRPMGPSMHSRKRSATLLLDTSALDGPGLWRLRMVLWRYGYFSIALNPVGRWILSFVQDFIIKLYDHVPKRSCFPLSFIYYFVQVCKTDWVGSKRAKMFVDTVSGKENLGGVKGEGKG